MRQEIVYGNEAEIEAETERIKFELRQLAARDWTGKRRTANGLGCGQNMTGRQH